MISFQAMIDREIREKSRARPGGYYLQERRGVLFDARHIISNHEKSGDMYLVIFSTSHTLHIGAKSFMKIAFFVT